MKLFRKTFLSVLIPFVVIISFVSYLVLLEQISHAERNAVENHKAMSRLLSKQIEVGYFESKWPFESLKRLSEHKGFLFWWIVRDDGTIHLADNASFVGTYSQDYFPEITGVEEKEDIILNRGSDYAIIVNLLETGERRWAFWLGCSMKEVTDRKKEIVFLTSIVSLSALVIFGVVLYFTMKKFTKPIRQLSIGAARIGKGDLTHRLEIKSKDEMAELAESFNKMTGELKRSRDELIEAKEYTDNIVNSMMNSLIVVSSEGQIRYVNPVTCSLLGYEENEIVGKHMGIIFAEEGLSFKESDLGDLIKRGEIRNLEKTYLSKNGEKIPVLFSMSVMRDQEEKIQGIVCEAQDITERRRSEEAFKESEKRYRQVVENAAEIIYATDVNGNFTYANPAALKVAGYPLEELQRFNYLDLIIPEHRQRLKDSYTCQFRERQATTYVEFPFLNKSGEVKWFGQSASLVMEGEKVAGFHVIARDITERKQAEESLRESEKMANRLSQENAILAEIGRIINSTLNIEEVYDRFVEKTRNLIPLDGIAINMIDYEEGTVTVPYVAGVTIPGCKYGDIFFLAGSVTGEVARTCSSLVVQTGDRNALKDRFPTLLSAFETGLRSVMVVPLISKDKVIGAIHFRSTRQNAYSDQELKLAESIASQIAGAIVNARLFAEQKRAEENLEKYRDHLEKLVEERADRIQELEHQRTEIEKVAASGMVAARIAHEINNPLAGIKNSFLLVRNAIPKDHPYYEYVDRIEKEIARIARLVRQLFDLYQPDQKVATEFSIDKTITDIVALLRTTAQEHKISIEVDVKPVILKMNEGPIRQVFYNILLNAIEASPECESVRILTGGDRDVLEIRISDQGAGVPEDISDQIFEPFFTTKHGSHKGLGLGLSISKEIIEAMGGSIDFQSEVGKGTVFTITLPLQKGQKEIEHGPSRPNINC